MRLTERLSERVAIMNLGKLVTVGSLGQLKDTLKGGEVLEVTIGKDGPRLEDEVLTQFKEVHHVNQVDNKILVYLNFGRLMLPKIVEALTSQGYKVESIHLKEVALEDVFLTYTGQQFE